MSFWKTTFTLLAIVAVLAIFYFLPYLSPGAKADYDYMYIDPHKESVELKRESEALEAEFEKEASAGKVSNESLDKLRRAIKLQELYIKKSNSTSLDKLRELKRRLQNIEAAPIAENIAKLEELAEAEFEAKRYSCAQELYKEAYDKQSTINNEYRDSDYRDLAKTAALTNKSKNIVALPLYNESLEAEAAAKRASEANDWLKAQAEYERAIAKIEEMIALYPDSPYRDILRLQNLEIERDSLKSAGLDQKKREYLNKAIDSESKKDYIRASEYYGDALGVQKEINKLFPKSKFASEDYIVEYERKRVESYSKKFAEEIMEQVKTLDKSLKEKNFALVTEITDSLLRKTEQFKKDFPQSRIIDDDLSLRLSYINFIKKDIPEIQELVNANLLSVEEHGNIKMLSTEVTQKLYFLVMRENPSKSSTNMMSPVDSVTLDDVNRFNKRLSWILGKNVDLPDEKVFIDSVGSLRYVDINEISWNQENSGSATHPVATKKRNDKGFYDLLGNVAEFVKLVSPDPFATVKKLGGSAQDTTDSIALVTKTYKDSKQTYVDPKQRNRMLGFRIIVFEKE